MDFSGRIILSFIEEDNIQRAYFRVRPLLTEEGAVPQADIEALLDDGYLRVVPDKNEQHTFKERMRELGSMCVLDLLNLPPDTVKVRSNKNYAPARGETNQFIVYSDAVQAVPQRLFFEVISAEADDKEKIGQSSTPLCYLRNGGKIYGPVSRATGLEQEGAAPLAPDSDGIYSVTLPDGSERLFYWPHRSAKPVHPNAIIDETENPVEDKPAVPHDEKLNGMPLYQTVARRPAVQQRAHNALMEAVGQQMGAARIEAPGAVLPAGTETRQVENPMDAFKGALDALWPMPDLQRQAVAHFLSLTGVQNILNKQLAGAGINAVSAAMNSQIQDLEAERLALIMQLEGAKKDLSALRRDALDQAGKEEKEALAHLRQEIEKARADLESLNTTRSALLAERDEAIETLQKAEKDTLRLSAPLGGYADINTLCERVQKSLQAAGIVCTHNDALHLLAVLCLCDGQMELRAETKADSLAAARAFAKALGTQAAEDFGGAEHVRVQAGGDGFKLMIGVDANWQQEDFTRLIVDVYGGDEEPYVGPAYTLRPWPVVHLSNAAGWKFADAPVCPPVKADCVYEGLKRDGMVPPEAALQLIDRFDAALKTAHAPLSHAGRRQIYAYLSAVGGKMDGGIASALDYAVATWILPAVRQSGLAADSLRELAQSLPHSLAILEEIK